MAVPLLSVNAQNHPLQAEFTEAFARVFRSGVFIMGPEVTALEDESAKLIGVEDAIGISSGTDAILLALMALGIGPGDEVLCPAFTFFATAGCVSRVGATPVFTDVCANDFNIDVADARAKITPRTKAIIPVHLFGQCADMDSIMALASEHNLYVIEDAAQAIGASQRGRGAGTIGHFGCYSFFPSKNLGGLGDGGLLATNDPALGARARAMRNHGMEPKYYHSMIGGNFRFDALQAALLRVKLPHYATYNSKRQANAAYYNEALASFPGLVLPVTALGNEHIWNQYTVRVLGEGKRDAMRDHLAVKKIGCEIYYPLTLDKQECFAALPESSRRGCEVSHQLAREVLSIPIFPELTSIERDEVAIAITEFLT